MGIGGISQLIQRIHTGIDRRIKANRIFRPLHIKVNRRRNPHTINPSFHQFRQTAVGAIPTDDNQCIQSQNLIDCRRLIQPLVRHHFGAACRMQNRTAKVQHIGNISAVHFLNFAANQPCIALADTHNIHIIIFCRSDNRTNCRVHAGRIAAAGQYADFSDFLFILPFYHLNSSSASAKKLPHKILCGIIFSQYRLRLPESCRTAYKPLLSL